MKIVYGFCYMAVDREDGRDPKIVNAHWRPGAEWPVSPEWIGQRLGTSIALKIRERGLDE